MTKVTDNHKDNVFCLLYSDRKHLLSLYNAMNGTDHKDEGKLKVVTLENAICISIRNDAAFIIDNRLNLYEQQATVNPNMPLRDLYYVAEELKKIMAPSKLYARKAVKVPTPRFIVFYNGTGLQPAEKILRLSDMYEIPTDAPELELTVRQININKGYNDDILEQCESLSGYMAFVNKVRAKTEAGCRVETAVTESVDECISEGILAEFFTKNRNKVIDMGIFEYDAELHDKVLREESFYDGVEEGMAKGRAEGKAEDVIELLEEIAPVPADVREEIMRQTDIEKLKAWLRAAARSHTLDEWKSAVKWPLP